MPLAWKSKDDRYFWTGWFDGQSFWLLAGVYALLSVTDLIATARLIPFGIKEGNPAAGWIMAHYGVSGFIIYKVALVAFLLAVVGIIDRGNTRLSRLLLWAGNITMGYIAILHIVILAFKMTH